MRERLPPPRRVGHTAFMRWSRGWGFALALALAAFVLNAADGPREVLVANADSATRAALAGPDTFATTVILVRHADKDTNFVGADPPLSAAGMLRAQELARVLGDVPFSTIYVTPWARNRQTAEPLARRLGDTLTVVDAIGETVRSIGRHPGEAVLVVGHSNTLPQILAALTQRSELDTLRVGYDDLFVLTLGPGRASRLVRLHYGAPTQFFR